MAKAGATRVRGRLNAWRPRGFGLFQPRSLHRKTSAEPPLCEHAQKPPWLRRVISLHRSEPSMVFPIFSPGRVSATALPLDRLPIQVIGRRTVVHRIAALSIYTPGVQMHPSVSKPTRHDQPRGKNVQFLAGQSESGKRKARLQRGTPRKPLRVQTGLRTTRSSPVRARYRAP